MTDERETLARLIAPHTWSAPDSHYELLESSRKSSLEAADRILSAGFRHVPDGYVVVPTKSTEFWWCAHCKEEIDGSHVTFAEHHESCGSPVTWIARAMIAAQVKP